ncbi:hypothetical protein [Bradyrhizobium prioriisuperbiae]|uniref:hypothetical protein n=1 Tax=Bradyrhizobium prioriisuperbiae TaxID=2854389 RepID=UPI0028E4A1B8|nr:hypothetical protein [Bradyrhizobium prioritasuperba]
MSLGDAMLAEILPHLPQAMTGTIVGAAAHAHVLSVLATRFPGLRVLVGTPVVETIGMPEDRSSAEAAAQQLVKLYRNGPPLRELLKRAPCVASHTCNTNELESGEAQIVQAEILRAGNATGVAIAGNISALSLLSGGPDWPESTGAILFLQSAEARRRDLDRAMSRLKLLGVLERAGAIIATVPIAEIRTPLDPSLSKLFSDVMEGTTCPVVINVFDGPGVQSLELALGRRAIIEVHPSHGILKWEADG